MKYILVFFSLIISNVAFASFETYETSVGIIEVSKLDSFINSERRKIPNIYSVQKYPKLKVIDIELDLSLDDLLHSALTEYTNYRVTVALSESDDAKIGFCQMLINSKHFNTVILKDCDENIPIPLGFRTLFVVIKK